MWRTRSRYFSRKTAGLPKASFDSLRAAAMAASMSAAWRTTRIPRPPPPCAAFTSTGPFFAWNACAARTTSGSGPSSVMPGTTGTPTFRASALAATLSPISRTTDGRGPMKRTPRRSQASAKSPFSERKP